MLDSGRIHIAEGNQLIHLKLLTAGVTLTLFWQLFELWRAGRLLKVGRNKGSISSHKWKVFWVAVLTIVDVLLIETQVRLSSQPYQSGALLVFHLVMVALLVLTFFVIIFRYTGLKHPHWHRRLVYAFYSFFFLAAATGSFMLYQLPA